MCGICGIVSSKLGERHLRTLLGDMNDSLVHRGPDDEGIFCTDGIGLGHRRLSIIDLAGGHQPMQNREGSVTVVFNGEIYNYRQLRKELLAKGHVFSTNSDTEVILNQYLEDGIGCLDKLRGMFAFAIWDDREKRLYLARDRIGIKPLYYAETGEGFIFASEIKALLKSGFIEPEMELNAVDSFLTVGLVPSPQTMFRGIRKLPPGCYALVDGDGNRTIRRYWS
ncbi:MAG TPA: asparagine synthetase B, partial [Gammaproteobacteria bacterium]|nr:asparagine synthetase B [Gammaproteobacteria bacterium]